MDSILWYNERNATAKYAFVLEHHLDRDGNADYPISGHKSDYEIAYIGGPGDSANMYVKVDPAAKAPMEKSFAEIQRINASLTNLLDGANIGGFEDTQAEFKCGPPEGVPIWQWIPAIFCWLGTVLPPSIGAGSCGPPLGGAAEQDRLFFASLDSDKDGIPDINTDSNKNGILDGYEMVRDGEILLNADLKRLGYRSATPLKATLKKDNRILAHDSFNEVEFSVKRIVAYDTKGVKKIVFARGGTGDLGSLATLQKYIGFTPIKVRAEGGIASYTISSKDNNLDVVLDARVSPKDKNGVIAFTKDSNEFTLEIRSENLIADSIADLTQSDPLRTGSSIFKAGEAKSIQYSFAVQSPTGKTKAEAPFEVRIVDDIDGRVLVPTTKISTEKYTYSGELLKQAGIYRLEFFDTQGRFVAKTLTIESGDSVRLDAIASSSVFVK